MYKITLKIDGMACGMCESHVNDTIRQSFSVKKVTSSHSKGETIIIANEVLPENAVKDAIKKTGYDVTGYTCEPYEKKGIFGRG